MATLSPGPSGLLIFADQLKSGSLQSTATGTVSESTTVVPQDFDEITIWFPGSIDLKLTLRRNSFFASAELFKPFLLLRPCQRESSWSKNGSKTRCAGWSAGMKLDS